MTTRTVTLSGSIAGKQFSGIFRRNGAGETNVSATLPAGVAGTLSARVDADTGTVSLPANHGLASGTFDLFWSGATPGCRRGMTGTLTLNSLALDGGAGDNLPALSSAVVVAAQVILDFDSDGASIVLATVSQQRRASVLFEQDNGAAILPLDVGRTNDGEPFVWASGTNVANPFGAAISKIAASNGSSAGSNVITVGVLRT